MRNQKGITLIALVITIIVLLILAGVSIAMLTGENGILTNAQEAQKQTAAKEAVEKINIALNAIKTEVLAQRIEDSDYTPVASTLTAAGITGIQADETEYTWNDFEVTYTNEGLGLEIKGSIDFSDDDYPSGKITAATYEEANS